MSGSKKKREGSNEAYALVYSTDPTPEPKCSKCNLPESKCTCPAAPIGPIKPSLRLEKKGRGGKEVTVLFRLPASEPFLKDLSGYLKRALGGGGTYYIKDGEGIIEIQGERREQIGKLLLAYAAPES